MFWCMNSTPESNGSADSSDPYYQVQICISWKPREGEEDVAASNGEKILKMKELCSDTAEPISVMVNAVPNDSEPYCCQVTRLVMFGLEQHNYNGRVTLAADSAHAMTMCRFFLPTP